MCCPHLRQTPLNLWASALALDIPEPEAFKPERFLNEDRTFRDDPLIPLAFGAGRRICPGRHFVDATLFIVTASVLSVFNVTKSKDKNGNEIPVAPLPLDSVQHHF